MHQSDPDLPPFARSWRQLYFLVIGSLLLEIVLFYGFMQYFS
ncbi:hypothetical protein [Larkinella arboricola]|uniref:Uncharacterized protein n=1 Tax=Larkinella arboricola TaxID=643671 RepID=A0A327WTY2_LARAB|nr:hypothetical protein [Larkinella arboricola]RAJ94481.1 hypothetical protein LX87_04368 [Larkinella arboricola]